MKTILKLLKWFFGHEPEWFKKSSEKSKQKSVEHAYWIGAMAR